MRQQDIRALTGELGYPVVLAEPAESTGRFPDGSRFHVEIPSCEGPDVMRAVVAEATSRGVRVRRVSQGSGVMMLTDAEITQMVELGAEHDIEVCLFLGPRGSWDVGAQAKVSSAVGGAARGNDGVAACIAEALRACGLGVRSLLVGDLGVLQVLDRLRRQGRLPAPGYSSERSDRPRGSVRPGVHRGLLTQTGVGSVAREACTPHIMERRFPSPPDPAPLAPPTPVR